MKFIIIFTIVIFCCSCITGSEIGGFNKCHTGKIIEIDKLCKINGYYLGKYSTYLNMPGGWTMILYKDGTCAIKILAIGQQDVLRGKDLYKISTAPSWGTYVIKDNIIISTILSYSGIHQSNVYEYKYKIINDTTLWRISSKRISDGKIWINDSLSNDYILPLKFISLENKPDSSCKLKEKEWFWCDKQKYNEYMKFDKTRSELYYEPKKK
jgi:hypothetical protein